MRGSSMSISLLALFLVATPLAAQEDALVAVGDEAPAVVIPDLAGGTFDLADVLGERPVLVEFWATWCTSCEAMLPRLRKAHAEFGDAVEFIGINVTVAETLDGVRQYVEDEAPPFRALYDSSGVAARAYGPPATSWIMIADSDGRVVYTGLGGTQNLEPALRQVAQRQASGRKDN